MLKRWPAFIRFLDGEDLPVEQRRRTGAPRHRHRPPQLAVAGSDRGGDRAAAIYTLIATAKLNDIDPQAWLADALRRIADHPASRLADRLGDLLPWNWQIPAVAAAA